MQIKYRIPMTSSNNNNNPSLPIHNHNRSSSSIDQRVPILLSPFVLALLLSLSFLLFLSLQIPHHRRITRPTTSSSNLSPTFSHSHLHLILSKFSSSHALIISSSHPHPTQDIQLALRQAGFAGPITETRQSQLSSPLPFGDESFELVFFSNANAFDGGANATDGAKLAQDVERMLKESGVCVLLVGVGSRMEKVKALFELSDVVEVRQVDGFDTQVILRKKKKKTHNSIR